MNYEHCQRLLTQPSLKLLGRRNHIAAFTLSFLHQEFRSTENRAALPEPYLLGRLTDQLRVCGIQTDGDEDASEALPPSRNGSLSAPDYQQLARRRLERWTDSQFLRREPDERGIPHYTLTPAATKTLLWLESLEKREFVAVGSLLNNLFKQLEDLVERSNRNPAERIRQLREQQRLAGEEIRQIQRTGKVAALDDTEVKGQFDILTGMAKTLRDDFGEVDDKLKHLIRELFERQLQQGITKGSALGFALDTRDALKNEDQGRSFYAFWDLLSNDYHAQRLETLIGGLYELLAERAHLNLPDDGFLRRLQTHLYNAANRVQESNERLTERLHQLVLVRDSHQFRRAQVAIDGIQALALRHRAAPPTEVGITLPVRPDVRLPWVRPLNFDAGTKAPVLVAAPPPASSDDLTLAEWDGIRALLPTVDTARLQTQIAELLRETVNVSLPTVLARYPLTQGLAELAAYVVLAAQAPQHHIETDPATRVWVPLAADNLRGVRMPLIVFVR